MYISSYTYMREERYRLTEVLSGRVYCCIITT